MAFDKDFCSDLVLRLSQEFRKGTKNDIFLHEWEDEDQVAGHKHPLTLNFGWSTLLELLCQQISYPSVIAESDGATVARPSDVYDILNEAEEFLNLLDEEYEP